MTAIPLWSALYGTTNPGDIQFSPDRLTAYAAGGGQDGIFVAVNLTALGGGPRIWGVTSAAAGVDIGIINGAELPTAYGDPTNGVMVRANGSIEFFSTATGYQGWGFIPGWTAGAKTWPVVNTAANMIWFTQDNVNFWGYSGTYPTGAVTSYSLSDVTAGNPGGIPTSHIAAIYPYVYIYSASGQPATTLDGTSAPPNGLFNIPGTLAISAPPTSTQGSATQIPWVSGRTEATAIQESPDGGSFVTAGGTNTGTSGTATGSTYGSTAEHTVALKSVTEPLDQTTPITFVAFPVVVGAGALLANIFIQYGHVGGVETLLHGPTSGTFSAPSSSLLYNVFAYTTGGSSDFGVDIYADGAQTVQAFAWGVNTGTNLELSADTASAVTSGSDTGTATYPRISGSGSIVIDSVSGTNSMGHGSVLNAGTAGGWSGSIMVEGAPSPATPYVNWKFSSGTVNDNIFAAQIYAAPAPETLTITGGSVTAAGSLRLTGTGPNDLLDLDISTDNGATYAPDDAFSIAGTNWTSQGTILSAGTYDCIVKDPATAVTSPMFPLTVTETITLDALSIGVGPSLTVDGTVSYANPSNVDISINGTWHNSDSYSLTSGAWPEALTAGLNSVPTGTLTVLLRDHTHTSVVSNPGTIVVSGEAITLTTATAYVNEDGYVTGSISGGTPVSLDVAINGTWQVLADYILDAGDFTGTVTGDKFPTSGSYTFQVRDTALPYILSNSLTESISYQEQIILEAVSNTDTALNMGGVTNYGPPAGMQYTVNGGGSWANVLTYTSDGGTLAVPFTATGAPLSFGSYRVQLRDTYDHSVVSNVVNVNIGSAETIVLTRATPQQLPPATGSLGDMLNRLRRLLPYGWFPEEGYFLGQGGPLLLAGYSNGGPPRGLNVSLDNGITWVATTNYVTSSVPINDPWTASGPVVGPGNYHILVQDAAKPSVRSNIKQLSILSGYTSAVAPVLTAVLSGPAAALSRIYGLIQFVRAQMRLVSSRGGWIDLWAYDFFGNWLRRRATEGDAPFITRIEQNLLAPLVTRQAMIEALTNLTGEAPTIFEAFNTGDAGCYDAAATAYGIARYGSLLMPAQVLINVNRPPASLAGPIPAYGAPYGGYGVGIAFYFPEAEFPGVAQDAEILATINRTKAAGVVCWVNTDG